MLKRSPLFKLSFPFGITCIICPYKLVHCLFLPFYRVGSILRLFLVAFLCLSPSLSFSVSLSFSLLCNLTRVVVLRSITATIEPEEIPSARGKWGNPYTEELLVQRKLYDMSTRSSVHGRVSYGNILSIGLDLYREHRRRYVTPCDDDEDESTSQRTDEPLSPLRFGTSQQSPRRATIRITQYSFRLQLDIKFILGWNFGVVECSIVTHGPWLDFELYEPQSEIERLRENGTLVVEWQTARKIVHFWKVNLKPHRREIETGCVPLVVSREWKMKMDCKYFRSPESDLNILQSRFSTAMEGRMNGDVNDDASHSWDIKWVSNRVTDFVTSAIQSSYYFLFSFHFLPLFVVSNLYKCYETNSECPSCFFFEPGVW